VPLYRVFTLRDTGRATPIGTIYRHTAAVALQHNTSLVIYISWAPTPDVVSL